MGSGVDRERSAGTLFKFRNGRLSLGLASCQLLYLLFLFSAGSGPWRLGSGLLARRAFQFLPFQLVFNFGGVCHV
jgi:hypothetical protein